jgi:hypothetical protein
MPETRHAKMRAMLPEGYQFGDARPRVWIIGYCVGTPQVVSPGWRRDPETGAISDSTTVLSKNIKRTQLA